jgi:L-amino acid N-acyltransferase YncA
MLEEEYQPRRQLPAHLRPVPAPETPFEYSYRDVVAEDLPDILEIYNHYVLNSVVTLDEKPMTLAALRRKFAKTQEKKMPFIVAVNPAGQILGFAYVYPWREKAAYRFTVENAIYLGPAATGKGLGKALLGELIERARAAGLKEMIAVIADKGAEASIAMHEKFGFKEVGHMGKVGFKFDRWLGSVLMQKSLKK